MSTLKKSPIAAEKIALYEKLLATIPGIERKGADNPYTPLNGNMFSLLLSTTGRMALRFSTDEREQFLKKYTTTLFEAYGAVMKECVAVPDALLRNTTELQKYVALSYAYVKTLKPETAKKKQPATLGL
jgi:TfoX/Sxy family transcriptional regulator of competence genes